MRGSPKFSAPVTPAPTWGHLNTHGGGGAAIRRPPDAPDPQDAPAQDCFAPRCAALRCAPRGRRVRRRRLARGCARPECGPVAAARQAVPRSLLLRSCRLRQTRRGPLAGAGRRGRARSLPPCAGEMGPHAPRGPATGGKPAAPPRAALGNPGAARAALPGAARCGPGPAPAAHDACAADLRQCLFPHIPHSSLLDATDRMPYRGAGNLRLRGAAARAAPFSGKGLAGPCAAGGPRPPAGAPTGVDRARCESGRGIVKSARDPAAAGE